MLLQGRASALHSSRLLQRPQGYNDRNRLEGLARCPPLHQQSTYFTLYYSQFLYILFDVFKIIGLGQQDSYLIQHVFADAERPTEKANPVCVAYNLTCGNLTLAATDKASTKSLKANSM